MRRINLWPTLQALLLSGFAVFALGFNHISLGQRSMSGMEGMSDSSGMSSVQCQILCTTAIPSKDDMLLNLDDEAKDPLPLAPLVIVFSLALLAVSFIVKRLYLLSSWRPPDLVLLCGRYADGL